MNRISLFFLLLLIFTNLKAQHKKLLQLDDVWKNPVWLSKGVDEVNWFKNGTQYSVLKEGNIEVFDLQTGLPVKTLVSGSLLKEGTKAVSIDNYSLSPDESMVLIEAEVEPIYRRSSRAFFYLFDLRSNSLKPVRPGIKISLATFSPDGKKLAYTYSNNLYVFDIATGKESTVTQTGRPNEVIHGSTDWVYEEEFEFWKAFDWSPDSKKIAFLSFDEREVPTYNMQLWSGLYPKDYTFKYPKAGEKNSRVDVSVYDLETGKTVSVDEGAENDQYIARMGWTRDPNILSVRRMNRLQNKMDLLHIQAGTGNVTNVLTETSSSFFEINDDLTYLPNGKEFIYSTDRSGFQHLYLYGMDGKQIRPLTSGSWDVTRFLGLDEKKGIVYFQSTEDGATQRQLYSVSISGKGKKKLSLGAGTHEAKFNPSFDYFIETYHSATRPPVFSLVRADGKPVKVLEDNQDLQKRLDGFVLSPKSSFEITTSEGIRLNAWMIRPANFDPTRRYPVLMHCYGGPGHQTVLDSWSGPDFIWYQVLASKGYIIVSVDNRGTGGKGSDFRKATYGQLGKLEWQDQTQAARYLAKQPYVDPARIGIWGWSFGGYLTSLCMTRSPDVFKTGIAVAPVTNWRFYDSIYTERYLKLPSENAAGYDENSPVTYADGLKGKFLLVHGTGDDNVHFQNAVTMVNALVKANKTFESFYYPNRNHGISGGNTRNHLYRMMTDFIERNL